MRQLVPYFTLPTREGSRTAALIGTHDHETLSRGSGLSWRLSWDLRGSRESIGYRDESDSIVDVNECRAFRYTFASRAINTLIPPTYWRGKPRKVHDRVSWCVIILLQINRLETNEWETNYLLKSQNVLNHHRNRSRMYKCSLDAVDKWNFLRIIFLNLYFCRVKPAKPLGCLRSATLANLTSTREPPSSRTLARKKKPTGDIFVGASSSCVRRLSVPPERWPSGRYYHPATSYAPSAPDSSSRSL